MQTGSPDLTGEQIAKWMRQAASRPPRSPVTAAGMVDAEQSRRHQPALDFTHARAVLDRAQAKNLVNAIKPLRRLRRNQGAVNQAVIDSLGALLTLTQQMAREMAALAADTSVLRRQLTESKALGQSGTPVDPL